MHTTIRRKTRLTHATPNFEQLERQWWYHCVNISCRRERAASAICLLLSLCQISRQCPQRFVVFYFLAINCCCKRGKKPIALKKHQHKFLYNLRTGIYMKKRSFILNYFLLSETAAATAHINRSLFWKCLECIQFQNNATTLGTIYCCKVFIHTHTYTRIHRAMATAIVIGCCYAVGFASLFACTKTLLHTRNGEIRIPNI